MDTQYGFGLAHSGYSKSFLPGVVFPATSLRRLREQGDGGVRKRETRCTTFPTYRRTESQDAATDAAALAHSPAKLGIPLEEEPDKVGPLSARGSSRM
jgi:hypothetical protein